MTAIVRIGAVTMDGTYQVADEVFQVGPRFFRDWYSVPDSKSDINERPLAHGAFGIAREWRSSLVLEMAGWFRGDSWLSMLNALRAAVSTGAPITVFVTDDQGTTSRKVSVRRFVPSPDPGARVCEFSILMVAVNPLRYGPEISVSTGLPTPGGGLAYPLVYPVSFGAAGNPGRVIVSNPGTAETFSMLEVTGGMSGGFEFTEIITGRVNRFVRPVPAGSTVLINLRTGRAFLDGPSDGTQYWTRQERWSVPRGGSRTIQFAALGVVTGTPTLTARTAPGNW